MKKLILGIAGIIVLDLAFILALVDVDNPTELAAVAPPRPIPYKAQLPVEEPTVNEEDAAAQAKPVRKPTMSKGHSAKNSVRPARSATFNQERTAPKFENTVIWYHGPDRKNDGRKTASVASIPAETASDEPARKKRNMLSRAFSVTKKPYHWVKSFAAKF